MIFSLPKIITSSQSSRVQTTTNRGGTTKGTKSTKQKPRIFMEKTQRGDAATKVQIPQQIQKSTNFLFLLRRRKNHFQEFAQETKLLLVWNTDFLLPDLVFLRALRVSVVKISKRPKTFLSRILFRSFRGFRGLSKQSRTDEIKEDSNPECKEPMKVVPSLALWFFRSRFICGIVFSRIRAFL